MNIIIERVQIVLAIAAVLLALPIFIHIFRWYYVYRAYKPLLSDEIDEIRSKYFRLIVSLGGVIVALMGTGAIAYGGVVYFSVGIFLAVVGLYVAVGIFSRSSESEEIADHNDKLEAELISDYEFIRNLQRLRELRSFLIQEGIPATNEDLVNAFSLGELNLLRFGEVGRAPTLEEWSAVDRHTQVLFALLTEPLRRRFILREISSWISVSIVFATTALLSLFCSVIVQDAGLFGLVGIGVSTLAFYIIWVLSLRAIGSVAFIVMNGLSVKSDITSDITNHRILIVRITLGALFALLISLPFGFYDFLDFVRLIYQGGPFPGQANRSITAVTAQVFWLLSPFILGFSTSLVIMLLNRVVDAVQAFFGRPATALQPGSGAEHNS